MRLSKSNCAYQWHKRAIVAFIILATFVSLPGCARKTAPPIDAAAIFNTRCALCHHDDNDMRAPEPEALKEMSRSSIRATLENGRMKWEARNLSKAQKAAVADYLGKSDVAITAKLTGVCPRDLDPPPRPPIWAGWGVDVHNTRFQPTRFAGLDRDSVQGLKLKWSFGFPGAAATYSQPTSFAGTVFVGSEDGTVYALDAATGCSWWTFRASATVKTAISVGNDGHTALFGDTNGYVYGISVADGSLQWRVHPESHQAARITGSPLLDGKVLYVPISSGEEGAAADSHYPCCTFRGSVVALDTATGKQIWKTYVIDETPQPTRKGPQGVQYYGPSGAAIWSPPTADGKRHVIYVATGNNYSAPETKTSDAVIAMDMRTGKKLWYRQLSPGDVWNSGCVAEQKDNCPESKGDDFDFGAPPMLKTLADGRDILLAAQKSGVVYALDPDRKGKLLWQKRIGKGGLLGGIQWGGAADGRNAYFTVSDYSDTDPLVGGGVYALDLRTGKQVWYAAPPKPVCVKEYGCSAAQMAPPTVIGGVVLAGSLDGHLRAYDSRNGTVIWDFDTDKDFQTTNGLKAHGGSLNGGGPAVVSGMVYVNSGYTNAMAGNVLLAFSVGK